jgi:class 3 adenylate cyclase
VAAPVTSYATTRDGRKIAWSAFGDGPVDLVYVPQSVSAMEHIWDHPTVTAFFAQLSSFCRVIMFDRRGSGMSERLEWPASLEEQVDDVHAVMDAAGSERAFIYALYEGGPMAMLFAAAAPERVAGLVLYASMARFTYAPGYEWAWAHEVREERMTSFSGDWGRAEIMMHGFCPSYVGDRRLQEWMARLQRLAMDPAYALKSNLVNSGVDIRPVLPTIRVPTLIMHRRDDAGFDPRHSQFLAEHIPDAKLVMLEGRDSLPFLGDSDAVLGEIEQFVTGGRAEREADRVLATVMFTDICKSTERAAELGDSRWRSLLEQHDSTVLNQLARHHGKPIKSVGDGYLATFDGPARAIRAARGIAAELQDIGLDIRAGLHTGECEVIGEDVGGMAVHIAARVMANAGPQEVVVSNTVKDLVVGSELRFEDRGEHELRGVPGAWRLWKVAA